MGNFFKKHLTSESELYNADTSDIEIGELFYKLVDGDLITEYGLSKILETIRLEAEFNKELLTAEIQLSCGNPIKHKMDESKLETLQAVISDENKLSKILTGEATPATDYTYPPTEFSKLISQIISHKENNSLTFTLNNGAAMQAV